MSNLTRNLTIGSISLLVISSMLFIDVRMQTASAEILSPIPAVNELRKPVFTVTIPTFDSSLGGGIEISTNIATSMPTTAASSHLQVPGSVYASPKPGVPLRLVIPSIGLDAPVEHLGKNAKGEMDVPSGDTGNVGWYENGTVPGRYGSAVIAAHVFAAFSELQDLAPGSDVYIITDKNERLHFIVEEAKEYALEQVSAHHLFNRRDAKRLNLITCAGQFIPSVDTYNRRLIVYTKLVE